MKPIETANDCIPQVFVDFTIEAKRGHARECFTKQQVGEIIEAAMYAAGAYDPNFPWKMPDRDEWLELARKFRGVE